MPAAQNHVIARLPRIDRERLLAVCQPVDLVLSEVLAERGGVTRHVYFPVSSFISLVHQVDQHPAIEVGMVGHEGLVGVQLALGMSLAPVRALVQGPGMALRIDAAAFRRELAGSAALQTSLNRYLYVFLAQLAASASCLRFHRIGSRLARWLLMTHDRASTEQLHVTHEFLAYMLGVRRVSITQAAKALQGAGLIQYHRGELTVTDRTGLEAAACSCYATDRASYATVMRG